MKIIRRDGRKHHFEVLEPRYLLTGSPFISEFVASNNAGLQDKDGAFSDWLEITNPAGDPVNLNGWYLTDDAANLTKWQVPNVSVPAGGTLVVFASNKNRTDPTKQLHTNFKLSSDPGYLGLVKPDGATIDSEFSPTYPTQTGDISFGVRPDTGDYDFLKPTPAAANSTIDGGRRTVADSDGGAAADGLATCAKRVDVGGIVRSAGGVAHGKGRAGIAAAEGGCD